MIKVNLGNNNVRIQGYENSAELFAAGRFCDNGSNILLGEELNTFPWPLEDNSVSAAKLFFTLEMPHGDKSVLELLNELYRVCCDGAAIEIRVHSPAFIRSADLPFALTPISFNTLNFCNRQYRARLRNIAEYAALMPVKADGSDIDLDLRILKSEVTLNKEFADRIRANEFSSQESLQAAMSEDPRAVSYHSFRMTAVKSEGGVFALAQPEGLDPFVMKLRNISEGGHPISESIAATGRLMPVQSRLFARIAAGMAAHKAEYSQRLYAANVGANIGWYSLLSAMYADNVHVDSFEPDHQNAEILRQNVHLNAFDERISVYEAALCSHCGDCEFFTDESNDGAGSLIKQSENGEKVTVRCDTLDNIYLNRSADEWPSLLMIDTFGSEDAVLRGGRTMFERGYRPLIISEFTPKRLAAFGECTFHKDLPEKFGYTPYIINHNDQEDANLFATNVDFLNATFESMKNDADSIRMLTLVFVPDWMDIKTLRPKV